MRLGSGRSCVQDIEFKSLGSHDENSTMGSDAFEAFHPNSLQTPNSVTSVFEKADSGFAYLLSDAT